MERKIKGDFMNKATIELKEHPIMLTLRDAVSGDGFLASITLSGRALMRREDDGKWWMYGVRPAGIAASGDSIEEAFSQFRKTYTEVLFDIAQEKRVFEDFKAEVESFFYEADVNDEDEQLWEKALTAIRAGEAAPPDEFSKLPRESPETKPTQISVERLDRENRRFMPSDNVSDTYSVPMAHAA
jgi:predicted RNase H-like HicB family nuclease